MSQFIIWLDLWPWPNCRKLKKSQQATALSLNGHNPYLPRSLWWSSEMMRVELPVWSKHSINVHSFSLLALTVSVLLKMTRSHNLLWQLFSYLISLISQEFSGQIKSPPNWQKLYIHFGIEPRWFQLRTSSLWNLDKPFSKIISWQSSTLMSSNSASWLQLDFLITNLTFSNKLWKITTAGPLYCPRAW